MAFIGLFLRTFRWFVVCKREKSTSRSPYVNNGVDDGSIRASKVLHESTCPFIMLSASCLLGCQNCRALASYSLSADQIP